MFKALLQCVAKAAAGYRAFHTAQHGEMERDLASFCRRLPSSVSVWNAQHVIFFFFQ